MTHSNIRTEIADAIEFSAQGHPPTAAIASAALDAVSASLGLGAQALRDSVARAIDGKIHAPDETAKAVWQVVRTAALEGRLTNEGASFSVAQKASRVSSGCDTLGRRVEIGSVIASAEADICGYANLVLGIVSEMWQNDRVGVVALITHDIEGSVFDHTGRTVALSETLLVTM